MAKHFDLRKQLKLHDKELLRQLFAERGAMLGISWESIGPHGVEPLVAEWELMGDERRHFQVILQDVNELADPRGQKVLLEELEWRCPDRLPTFQALKSPADKALWVYLEVRAAFDAAAIFARAEALRNGNLSNRWDKLPKTSIQFTQEMKASLENQVRTYYWKKELRGDVCRVHHYSRLGGSEFFFAYLPDWPDKQLIFDADQNLTPREETYAFSNVFIYDQTEGAVDLIARGGTKVHLFLRKAFCSAVFGIEVDDDEPIRATYQLDHLLDPGFSFTTESADRIAAVRMRRIRIVPKVRVPAVEYLEPKFTENASRDDVLAAIDKLLGAFQLTRSQVAVTQVGIQLKFMSDGHGKQKSLTFNVTCPNTCDLKSKPDDARVVGERCIKRWEILCG